MKDYTKVLKQKEKVFKKLLDNFKSQGISIIPPDTKTAFKRVEKNLGVKLSDTLGSFYEIVDGFSISWRSLLHNYWIKGANNIRFLSLIDSLDLGEGRSLSFSTINYIPPQVNLKGLKIFDTLDSSGNYVLIDFKNDETLYLYTYKHHLNKLKLNVQEYLDLVIVFFGLNLWQQYYLDDVTKLSNYYITDSRYKLFLEKIITEENTSKIQPILDKIDEGDFFKSTIDYVQLINERIDQLKQLNEFGSINKRTNYSVSLNDLMKAQEAIDTSLPKGVIDFYLQTNGLQIEWSTDNIHGAINLLPFEEIFGGEEYPKLNLDWDRTMHYPGIVLTGEEDDEYIEIANKLRPIELFEGDSGFVGFIVNDEKGLELYYSSSRGNIVKLPISFERYLELSIKLLGINGWQEYYIYGEEAMVGKDRVIDTINEVFPKFDIKNF